MEAYDTPFERSARPGRRIGHRVEVHPTIGSTSDRARELLEAGDDGVAVVAELQTAGRGRRGRTWSSPAGRNLMLSVGLALDLAAERAPWVGMAAALAVRDALAGVAGVALKWPNDLVDAGDRKLGGLLVDTVVQGERVVGAVIGIGINVNWPVSEMPAELRATATSVLELSGRRVDRGALLAGLLEALEREIGAVEVGRSPLERYRAACRTIGRDVLVDTGDRRVGGRAVGIGEDGALVVDTGHGIEAVTAGEVVRVRPAVPA